MLAYTNFFYCELLEKKKYPCAEAVYIFVYIYYLDSV